MIFEFRSKLYQGTRPEIVEQLVIDLRDLLGYNHKKIQMVLNQIPKTFDIEIGSALFNGTKEEILEQAIAALKIAPVVSMGCWVDILGLSMYIKKNDHFCSAKDQFIEYIKERIDAL